MHEENLYNKIYSHGFIFRGEELKILLVKIIVIYFYLFHLLFFAI